jgi:hypothetical protein
LARWNSNAAPYDAAATAAQTSAVTNPAVSHVTAIPPAAIAAKYR